jgi:BlaI family transcriptional regulator, penicillinase repressor
MKPMATKEIWPTRLELSILRVLWDAGPSSVREIHEVLNQSKPTGYTTVLKMLQIMTDKGLVERDETVRPQIYRPRMTMEQTQRGLLHDLIQRAYGNSLKSLVLHALETRKSTAKDLKAIEKLLDRFERRAEGSPK